MSTECRLSAAVKTSIVINQLVCVKAKTWLCGRGRGGVLFLPNYYYYYFFYFLLIILMIECNGVSFFFLIIL